MRHLPSIGAIVLAVLAAPAEAAIGEAPKSTYLLCKGALWSHESGFGSSASTPGTTTVRVDHGAQKLTFQTLMLGELQGELKSTEELYSSRVDLPKAHAHMGRSVAMVEISVDRFTGRASISYVLADGGKFPGFVGECQLASPKF